MCTITIDPNVEGGIVNGILTSVRVKGTSTDCNEINVTIRCGSGAPLSMAAFVDFAITPNTWLVEFTDPADLEDSSCLCGGRLEISAECVGVPDCSAETITTTLRCVGDCPEVTLDHSVSENCSGGKREVTLTVTNLGPGNPKAQWEVEPGVFVPGIPFSLPPPGGSDTKTHPYSPGSHSAILHIVDLENCPDPMMDIEVAECPDIPCPTINFDVKQFNCRIDGNQPTQIKAIINGPAGTTISARLKEGVSLFDQGESDTGTLELDSSTLDFSPGSHTISVEVLSPADCPIVSTTFEVNCEPRGACCLPDGSCEELTEEECRERNGVFKSVGASCADVNCGGGNGDGECAWFNPTCWSLCGWLGILLANAIAGYLILLASGANPGISAQLLNLPGFPNIEPKTLFGILGSLLAAMATGYGALCGLCNLGKAMVAGAALGLGAIVIALIFGGALPDWPEGVIAAIFMGASGIYAIQKACD